MIIAKTMKWGNSLGLRIKKEDALGLGLLENEDVIVDIQKKVNPLKMLFGFDKENKLSRDSFEKNRKSMESRWV